MSSFLSQAYGVANKVNDAFMFDKEYKVLTAPYFAFWHCFLRKNVYVT